MGNADSPENDQPTPESSPEGRLRGAALEGAEQKNAADHTTYEKTRHPDAELRLDGEKDTLYSDGLDIEEDVDTLAGTRGPSSGIKP